MATVSRLQVRETRDDDAIYDFLARDRGWGGYAICDLEPGPRSRSRYWLAANDGVPVALCLVYRMSQLSAIHTFGDSPGIAAILARLPDPPAHAWVLAREPHLVAVRSRYEMNWPDRMRRMIATREAFSPVPSAARRLTPRDAAAVADLYAAPGGASARVGAVLAQTSYGVWEGGRLISIAGTHGLSRRRGIAAIGNVFTHPAQRDRGYATMCVSALMADLMRVVPQIILNVNANNAPALRVYERVGFRRHCTYREGRAVLLSAARDAASAAREDPRQRRPGRRRSEVRGR